MEYLILSDEAAVRARWTSKCFDVISLELHCDSLHVNNEYHCC
ncbi:uncharacterized protein RAG0_01076 [Rhynchosporium agropyri]|uniref:Uncharacterized protein n=1 Tax=Rhynchosporium agropyri TaxID=914238 RepID=A0A1E1JVI6_9HELO|nr:uncharacterized protein RAG0_01076 [Rhynchosporium agropyri]